MDAELRNYGTYLPWWPRFREIKFTAAVFTGLGVASYTEVDAHYLAAAEWLFAVAAIAYFIIMVVTLQGRDKTAGLRGNADGVEDGTAVSETAQSARKEQLLVMP